MAECTYVDQVYKELFGAYPEKSVSPRDRRITVMEHWDPKIFTVRPSLEAIAMFALCEIGKAWHSSDGYPYSLKLINDRLREVSPGFEGEEIVARTYVAILDGKHPSQYARPARTKV